MSNPDNTGTCPGLASSEHQPTKQIPLTDLPTHVIEEIVRHIGEPLCCFAAAHPRLATIFAALKQYRIEIDHVCENWRRTMALNSQNLRALILLNCHSESSLILSLILECPRLTELNTVNSGLTIGDLVHSINFLSELETLKCSWSGVPNDAEEVSLLDNHSIKSMYVEHAELTLVYLLKLINSLLRIERLHLVQLQYLGSDANYDILDEPSISRERWQTLQTVILAGLPFRRLSQNFRSVFRNCAAISNVTYIDFCPETEIVYDRGTFNMRAPRRQTVDHDSSLLSRMHSLQVEAPVWHYGPPKYLKISRSSFESLPEHLASLTTLVELDLSHCHTGGPHIWLPFLQSLAGLESLLLPLCLLTTVSYDEHGNEGFPVVEASKRLKLKKFCCYEASCKLESCLGASYPSLPFLTGLTHLEELTLMDPPVGGDFFSRIAVTSISCLRIYTMEEGHLNFSRLKGLLETCEKLRYLKLSWDHLPLHEELLWRHLSHANLKELCMESSCSEPVDLDMIRRYLPKLCESLDVLHVHAPAMQNVTEFSSYLTAEIANINLTREHNPVWSIPANSVRHYICGIVENFPGRALCCPRFEGEPDLVGWDID